jgi:hypothetical protein
MRRHLLLACLVLLPGSAVLACSDQGPESVDLGLEVAANRALWQTAGPATYVYEVERSCFCPVEALGPVRVQVEDGAVTRRTYTASGDTVRTPFADIFPAVDGLFDILERAIDQDAADVRVTWDPDTGLPLDFSIDYIANAIDEEVGYRIVDVPRTTP